MTLGSKWHSKSRSRSLTRSDLIQQQRRQTFRSSREKRMQSLENRLSSETGEGLFVAKESGIRLRYDHRKDAEWQSQLDGYSDTDEPLRPYRNQQAVYCNTLRHGQPTRASSSYEVHRRSDNEIQRWNHSRLRSPQYYVRAASPLRRDRDFSNEQRSSLPHDQVRLNRDKLSRQLLAKRVVSVEMFRDEMHNLHNGVIHQDDLKRSHEAMVRIPVVLWPNESMTEYAHNFERWLESRKLSLALLRGNPAEERSLWHSFACKRAGISELGEPRLRSRSQSLSQSSQRDFERSRPLLKSSNRESKAHSFRREYARSPDRHNGSRSAGIQHPLSMANPAPTQRLYGNRTRRQLLERRVLLLEDFQKEVDQSSGGKAAIANNASIDSLIPVPLYPKESMGYYDHCFWVWLRQFGETKDSLRSDPLRERRFRLTFASLRLKKPQPLAMKEDHSIETQTFVGSRPNIETHTKIPVGELKTAQAHVVANGKRPVETANRQDQTMPDESKCKRARIDAEGMTQVSVTPDLSSSHSTVCPEQKGKTELSMASSNQALPQSSSVLTIASPAKTILTATASTFSAGSLRPSFFPQAAPEKQTAMDMARTARSASIPDPRKQTKMRAKHLRIAPDQNMKTEPSSNVDEISAASRDRVMVTTAETALSASSVTPEPTLTTAVALIQASRNTAVSPATTTITKEKRSINVAENNYADTDAAEYEPDIARTESMTQEEFNAQTDPPGESEQHDGDVMNFEGCCCNKCMRSWVKTLTNRMDQLEQNVLDLKRQVIGQVDVTK